MYFNKFKKLIGTILIIGILVNIYSIPKAEAQWAVLDGPNLALNKAILVTLNSMVNGTPAIPGPGQASLSAGKIALRFAIRQLTSEIVSFIDNGFKDADGNSIPGFVTNPEQFFLETADGAIGEMLLGSELDFLCDPFKIDLKLSMGLQYQPFKNTIACTLTGAINNATTSIANYADFIGSGGWGTFLEYTTLPANNQMGAGLLVQMEIDDRIADKKLLDSQELSWGGGFLSWKDCPETATIYDSESGTNLTATNASDDARIQQYADLHAKGARDTKGCVVKTPGKEIADHISWINSTDLRQLEIADSLDAIINALANQVVKNVLEEVDSSLITKAPGSTQEEKNLAELARLEAEAYPGAGGSASGNNSAYNGTGGSANFNAASVANKTIALTTIDNQIAIETNFLAAQANMYEMLEATESVFNNSNCTTTIKNSVISEINGTYTANFTSIPWNKPQIEEVSAITTNPNLTTLTSTKTSVTAATTDAAIPNLIQGLTTLNSLHTAESVTSVSAGGTAFTALKNWVSGKITTYSSQCTIDKTPLAQWGI